MAHELVDNLLVGSPVIGEAAEMGEDEVDVRVLWRKHIGDLRAAGHIHQHGECERLCSLADLTGRHRFMAVNLDSPEAPSRDRVLDHAKNPPRIALGMHEGEADQPRWPLRHELRDLTIGPPVVGVKRRHHDGLIDSGGSGATQVAPQWSRGIPGRG